LWKADAGRFLLLPDDGALAGALEGAGATFLGAEVVFFSSRGHD